MRWKDVLKKYIRRITLYHLKAPLSVIIAAADTIEEDGKYSEQNVGFIADSADLMKPMFDEKMLFLQIKKKIGDYEFIFINALSIMLKKMVLG